MFFLYICLLAEGIPGAGVPFSPIDINRILQKNYTDLGSNSYETSLYVFFCHVLLSFVFNRVRQLSSLDRQEKKKRF